MKIINMPVKIKDSLISYKVIFGHL